ncbi:NAD(P)H-dependent oxidoreductase [Variovorax brevis]|uniref:NAD(P)H-dependent oxidoreductase n=1 Tax=Variovorax brevis TaxID=3053503 RepID=UPI00336554BF
MASRIVIIQGHPDGRAPHFCHALAQAYADGARSAGHEVSSIDVGSLEFEFLRSKAEWEAGTLPPQLSAAQEAIGHAQHLLIVFPLWLGDMPAALCWSRSCGRASPCRGIARACA